MSMSSTSIHSSHDRKVKYRAILRSLNSEQENDNNEQRMENTAAAVQEVQSLLAEGGVEERVRHPGENYLDSRVLKAASDLAISCSEAVSGMENNYDKHEFALRISENPKFWELTFPREVPVICSLHGTFAPTPPEQRPRAPRRRVERQEAAALKAPENVERLEKTDEASELVNRVHRFITRKCREGVSYYHLVLDPTSFTKSVENIYYVSFLVRDGLVSVYTNEDFGLPFVKPVTTQAQRNSDISDENQFIVSIDMERWRKLISAFGIESPMMVLKT
ncbi:EP300-interacting inhibitor of differentiation 3-like [Leptidea sinapis]|uniref:EP300-interacting inhibitor of differentiation 3-like n=1 Tax=Leptidea sinapis TaxID=189913 RepID=UPI00213139C0|nr:EP300-interacting inhibitor of differentiation 3-like [Leptidea sinapis]